MFKVNDGNKWYQFINLCRHRFEDQHECGYNPAANNRPNRYEKLAGPSGQNKTNNNNSGVTNTLLNFFNLAGGSNNKPQQNPPPRQQQPQNPPPRQQQNNNSQAQEVNTLTERDYLIYSFRFVEFVAKNLLVLKN